MMSEGLGDPKLEEALEIFQVGQREFARALAGMSTVKFVTSSTSEKPSA